MAGFFDRFGRALSSFWEELKTPDGIELPEPAHTHSVSDTEPLFPHAAPEPDIFSDHGLDDKSDFPQWWGEPEFKLWEREPQTYKPFYDEYPGQWRELIREFDKGWVVRPGHSVSYETRVEHRETFYTLAGMTAASFDWKAYRAYLAEVGS